ncbi:MAG: hypothetical protein GX916_02375 [Clostridiales bacterium]|jgi:WXG100 family type VII secretion target|nr:hypothetical protein [Clostridiales bacterium]
MAQHYDTAEIRMTARRVAAAAGEVRELSTRDVQRIMNDLDAGFKGMAADALRERLATVGDDIIRISRGLDAVNRDLMTFARNLDAADREVANEINRRGS